jgi:HTH-type transcriptional regulator/antitoxin HigA
MSRLIREVQPHWAIMSSYLVIRDETDYARAVDQLNELIDVVGTDEAHPLYEFLDTLGTLVARYEDEHHVMPPATGAEALRYLMEEHGLRQSDLPEVGSQGIVSEILRGKRDLNVRQIRALAQRFHVNAAVFL